jgi:RNA polymerase sigma-70 factor, ECF subfamily
MDELDPELAGRLAQGDESAFHRLYDACADSLHHYLTVTLNSRDDADDVLQETFTRLARTRRKLGRVENLRAYVFTVARNEAFRSVRRRSRDRVRWISLAAEGLFDEAVSDDCHARETAELVAAALARLKSELREVVELKAYAGLTLAEIAVVTGKPQGTIATRYRTALSRMRDILAREKP